MRFNFLETIYVILIEKTGVGAYTRWFSYFA